MQTNAAAESGIDEGQKLVILGVRPKEARMQDGIVPGAVPAQPEDLFPHNYKISISCDRISEPATDLPFDCRL